MENPNQNNDLLAQQRPRRRIPDMLNVLTILTFIGSGLGYLKTCYNFLANTDPAKQIEKVQEAQEKIGDNGFLSKIMAGSAEAIQKSYDNRYLLLVSGLVFITLCIVGAMRMRQLKKSGYYIYVVGELAPIVLAAGLFGLSFAAIVGLIFTALVAVIFVILYATQLKHLVNK